MFLSAVFQAVFVKHAVHITIEFRIRFWFVLWYGKIERDNLMPR